MRNIPTNAIPRFSSRVSRALMRSRQGLCRAAVLLAAAVPMMDASGVVTVSQNSSDLTPTLSSGCPFPTDGSVPPEYFAIRAPRDLLDPPPPPSILRRLRDSLLGSPSFNVPPAHNIGFSEGRLRSDLRETARAADPLNCSLPLAAYYFSIGDKTLGKAYADLSVTGRRAFDQFRGGLPGEDFCQSRALQPPQCAGAAASGYTPGRATAAGCREALDRAYSVANYLRIGQAHHTKKEWRDSLGWIAVSGEDDQPHRPVNVPSSVYPQYDIEVEVAGTSLIPSGAPGHGGVDVRHQALVTPVRIATRFTIAEWRNAPFIRPDSRGRIPTRYWKLLPDPAPTIDPDAEVLLYIHGMDSRAEEADRLTEALFARMGEQKRSKPLVVIAMDLPTSGYATNLDYERFSRMEDFAFSDGALGLKLTGRFAVLAFIEEYIVRFMDALEAKIPTVKSRVKSAMGGSLGGSMSFRLGRNHDLPWLPAVVAWSPASVWDPYIGFVVRDPWAKASDRSNVADASRREFFKSAFDRSYKHPLPGPPQSETWSSTSWPCHASSIAAARLDRHETYDENFRAWRWRLGAEQLAYSHRSADTALGVSKRFLANLKPMLLMCGKEDDFDGVKICSNTMQVATEMTATPGRAVFFERTGHAIDQERPNELARLVDEFLGLSPGVCGNGGTRSEQCSLAGFPGELQSECAWGQWRRGACRTIEVGADPNLPPGACTPGQAEQWVDCTRADLRSGKRRQWCGNDGKWHNVGSCASVID